MVIDETIIRLVRRCGTGCSYHHSDCLPGLLRACGPRRRPLLADRGQLHRILQRAPTPVDVTGLSFATLRPLVRPPVGAHSRVSLRAGASTFRRYWEESVEILLRARFFTRQ